MGNVTNLAAKWNEILCIFFQAFTHPTAQTFTRLVTGWILATGRRTITGVIPFADPEGKRAHDTYHNFFPDAAWTMSELWRIWAAFLLRRFCPKGRVPLILDDTLYHKSGRKVDGASWWRDAVRSTGKKVVHALGLNLVVLTVRVSLPWSGAPIAIPVNMRLHRKGGTGPLDLAEEMIREFSEWLPKREFLLVADGFYASLAGRDLPRTTVTSRMRRDAAIYEMPPKRRKKQRGRPRKKGKRFPAPEAMAKHVRKWKRVKVNERGRIRTRLVYARRVLWYKVCPDAPVLLVISRDPTGKEKDDFFFTTDVETPPEQVISDYAGRWSIEMTFKDTKQLLGGQEPQVWKAGAPERAAAFSLLTYGLVWTHYVLYGWRSIPLRIAAWFSGKKHPSFQDALSALRKELWRARIFGTSGRNPVPAKIIEVLMDALAAA